MFTHISRSVVFISLALAAIAALTVVCARHGQSSRDILTRAATPADRRISYGPNEFQFGELRLPKGAGPHPVAIVIHGGWLMFGGRPSTMGDLSARRGPRSGGGSLLGNRPARDHGGGGSRPILNA